jgi:hypothetical protein
MPSGKKYLPEERLALCEAWVKAYRDELKGPKLWQQVHKNFVESGRGCVERAVSGLHGFWYKNLAPSVALFCNMYTKAKLTSRNEAGPDEWWTNANDFYAANARGLSKCKKGQEPFPYKDCWQYLKEQPEWHAFMERSKTNQNDGADKLDDESGKSAKEVSERKSDDMEEIHESAEAAPEVLNISSASSTNSESEQEQTKTRPTETVNDIAFKEDEVAEAVPEKSVKRLFLTLKRSRNSPGVSEDVQEDVANSSMARSMKRARLSISAEEKEDLTASREMESDASAEQVEEYVEAQGQVHFQPDEAQDIGGRILDFSEPSGPILDFERARPSYATEDDHQTLILESINSQRIKEKLCHKQAVARMEMEEKNRTLDLQVRKLQLRMEFVLECAKQGHDVDMIEKLAAIAFADSE